MSRTEADEEVLSEGPGLPPWLPRLAAAVVVAVVLGLLVDEVSTSGNRSPPASAAEISAPAPAHDRPAIGPAPVVATGPPLSLPQPLEPLDVAVVGDQAWLLQGGRLSTFTTDASYVSREVRHIDFGWRAGQPRLLVDSARHRVWVVVLGAAGSTV